ncbi:MAG: hypothetical protein WCC66_16605 [Rhizobiaceae bacterium]
MRASMAFSLMLLSLSFAKAETLSFPAQPSGIVQFTTPARDIGCTYIPFDGAGGIETGTGTQPELHCYRLTGKFNAASLGPSGKAKKLVVEGKLDCCKGRNVLAYGSTWVTGGFACTAQRIGITCRRGPHGFSISRSAITRY